MQIDAFSALKGLMGKCNSCGSIISFKRFFMKQRAYVQLSTFILWRGADVIRESFIGVVRFIIKSGQSQTSLLKGKKKSLDS